MAMASKCRNNGQTCVCVNRIYVQDSVYEAFASKFSAAVGKLSPMNGREGSKYRIEEFREVKYLCLGGIS